MEEDNSKVPVWYWIVGVFFLLWNGMGIASFFTHIFISEETLAQLPENEQALYGEYPFWTTAVFALAVFAGTCGSLGLLLRKKWAKTAFVASLFGIIPQMIHNVFFTQAMEVYGVAQAITMPIMIVVFGFFLLWFSAYSIKRGWIK